jgi:glycosyltransferase involved in cell wall biosynthesis
VLDEELPYPANSGKRLRTLNLLTRLAKDFQISYLSYRSQKEDETLVAQEHLESFGIHSILVRRSVPRKSGAAFYGRLVANLISPLPYSVSSHTSAALSQEILRTERNVKPDLWHCEWTPYVQSLAPLTQRPIVAVAHNVESLIWRRYAENESQFAKRWYIQEQVRKFQRFEAWAFQRSARTVFVSKPDEHLARRDFKATRTNVVENGVDIDYFQPSFGNRDPHRLLIMGSLDWRPNIDGINLFVDGVFRRLRENDSRFSLSIIGRNPEAAWAQKLRDRPGVTLHANVPDVRPFIADSGALVVPLRIGGGSRLKILEAAASGLPVISTLIGAEGLDLTPDQHYRAATDINELERAIQGYVDDPVSTGRIAAAGYQVVSKHYSWDSLSKKLATLWLEVASHQ